MNNQARLKLMRFGNASPLLVGVLGAIFLAIMTLIVIRLSSERGSPPKATPPIKEPDRIRDALRPGKTYRAVVKVGFDARVEDKDYGLRSVTNLAYAAEMVVLRKIESNDGRRVVELRHFEICRNVKLLSEVDGVTIELGLPGTLALGALEVLVPGSGTELVLVKPIAEAILKGGAQVIADDQTAKSFAHVDSISGKKVRIEYVDGEGVVAIDPVDCELSDSEHDFVMNTAVLSDCYLLPNVNSKPDQSWNVDGSQFAGFLDPSIRGVPEGIVVIRRGQNEKIEGKQFASLEIVEGVLQLNASDKSSHRVGSFVPKGGLRFDLSDGYITDANFVGDFVVETVSKDHILFEARFHTQPRLKVSYTCEMN